MSSRVERTGENLLEMRMRRFVVWGERTLRTICEKPIQQRDSGFQPRFWLLVMVATTGSLAVGWQQKPAVPSRSGAEYSGMYSFLREGEFVQITGDDAGAVSGFVARYGDLESDKGVLLDHFFKSARLEGNRLTFTTEVVHGVSYDLQGTISRGVNKRPGEEGYYLVESNLRETTADENGKPTSRERGIVLKSLPRKPEITGPSSLAR